MWVGYYKHEIFRIFLFLAALIFTHCLHFLQVALPAERSSVAVQQSSPETAVEGNGGNAHELQLQKSENREIKKKILQLKLATEIEILKQTKINTKITEIELEEKLASKPSFN